ncbi:MAG: substrate-binding domain-containing protein, partial [Verrucomicrobiae bacterium]|nr:substrate-binding domain-containing protein [Verrucomicrobiae bacterium]
DRKCLFRFPPAKWVTEPQNQSSAVRKLAASVARWSRHAPPFLLALLVCGCDGRSRTTAPAAPLRVFCGAALKPPVEQIAQEYERAYKVPVELQYGPSQTLLASIEVTKVGDLYIPGDDSFLKLAREKDLIAETIPLARMATVVAVRAGNPKNIQSLADLGRADVKLGIPNPDATAVGKLARQALQAAGAWESMEAHATVFKPTPNDIAADVKLGALDAGLVFDAVAKQFADLEIVTLPELAPAVASVSVAVLQSSVQPSAALRFARYLSAADRGLKRFAALGYTVLEGDTWDESPEILLFSGAVNRVAVEETLRAFEQREGCRVTRVYNGCGILVGQMKSGGARPDAYLTCDRSFASPVADLFLGEPARISETDIVLVVPAGNPRQICELRDLARPGLRVGWANPDQSTLGALTLRMFEQAGIAEAVRSNTVMQTPTGDLLVNQFRVSPGSLDVVVAYRVNAMKAGDAVQVLAIDAPGARAEQTFSVGAQSKHKQLVRRLHAALLSTEAGQRYTAAGFKWNPEPRRD